MRPDVVKFNLGTTVYRQPLTLIRYRDTGGRIVWMLERGQADQRDDSSNVGGLTDEVILQMADAVKSARSM